MNINKKIENVAILTLIKMSKNCHRRFTATYPKFLASHSFHCKIWHKFAPTILKTFKEVGLHFRKYWPQWTTSWWMMCWSKLVTFCVFVVWLKIAVTWYLWLHKTIHARHCNCCHSLKFSLDIEFETNHKSVGTLPGELIKRSGAWNNVAPECQSNKVENYLFCSRQVQLGSVSYPDFNWLQIPFDIRDFLQKARFEKPGKRHKLTSKSSLCLHSWQWSHFYILAMIHIFCPHKGMESPWKSYSWQGENFFIPFKWKVHAKSVLKSLM